MYSCSMVISPQDPEELEDALALAEYRARQVAGASEQPIPHEEVRRLLGVERAG